MKKIKALKALILTAAMILSLCVPSFADSAAVVGPIPVTWSNLHIDATGLLSWKMELPEEYKDLKVSKYTVKLDIMTSGIWREGFRTYNTVETEKEINYGTVGIYRFRVMATFVGGYVTAYSDYSNECSVTSDYITKPETGGGSSGPGTSGPGGTSTPGTSSGPGTVTKSSNDVPDWAEKTGTWFQDGDTWYYINNGVLYKNKWACVYNPYAKTGMGQRSYDWFAFDENGKMRTGWYSDPAGNVFYLNPVADGSRGKMVTGWKQIDGYWYYFYEQEGTGYMGALATNTTINGYRVDAQGRKVN